MGHGLRRDGAKSEKRRGWRLPVAAGGVILPQSETVGLVMADLPENGLLAIVKRDCETCVMTAPVLGELARRAGLTVYSQDDASFPDTVPGRIGALGLDVSHRLGIEIVPTLIRFEGGHEVARTYGWDRGEWERISGLGDLGSDLPEARP